MARNEGRRILKARFALEQRFRDVADLPDNGDGETKQQQLSRAEAPAFPVQHEFAERERGDHATERTTDRTGLRLLGRQDGSEFRSSDGRAYHHRSRVADPGDDERE